MSSCWLRGWPGRCAGSSWSRTAWSRRCWRIAGAERIEPPGRVERISRVGPSPVRCLVVFPDGGPARPRADKSGAAGRGPGRRTQSGAGLLAQLKADPDAVSLDAVLTEIRKLQAVRALGLPADLFADVSEKLLAAWRARALKMYPSDSGRPGAGAVDAAGGVVLVTAGGDHRRAGRAADRPGPQDRCSGGEEG